MDSKNREQTENDLDFITDIIRLVTWSIATSVFCILGLVSNVINIVVFYRQGMKSTVNITFMALSITDLINVLFMWWVSISTYPLFSDNVDLTFDPLDVSYLTGAFPHGCMSRVTAWITVFMTAERWLCIALPFKAKQWITPRRATLAIIAIYLFTLLPLIPEYLLNQLNWFHHQPLNKTIVGLVTSPEYTYLTGATVHLESKKKLIPDVKVA
ncbi:FMRFamide receptor [Biomphalaria glabrata]|nr:FMRFamide receptor [Biomphalaria glabrata]